LRLNRGRRYLDHHQRRGEYDYFAVDARDGQKIAASIQALDYSVNIRSDKVDRSSAAYSGTAIHAPDRRTIVDRWVYTPGDKATISVPVGAGLGGRFYVLVDSLRLAPLGRCVATRPSPSARWASFFRRAS
jgi:hypothetical protein